MNCLPVGFFDSGAGGLSVLKQALEVLPNENFIYYGDDANAPYGIKTEEEIRKLTLAATDKLVEKGIKALVVACNTATSAAITEMRSRYALPVISMEPAVKPAIEAIGEGSVLVLATPATIRQKRYLDLLERLEATDRVINHPCPKLVDFVEDGDFSSPKLVSYVEGVFSHYIGMDIQAVILGCTHFIFLKDVILEAAKKAFNPNIRLFDGNRGTVEQLKRVLKRDGLCNKGIGGKVEIISTGNKTEYYTSLMTRI